MQPLPSSSESAEDIPDPKPAPLQKQAEAVETPEEPETSAETEQKTEAETEDLIAIHCPKQCIKTSLIFINSLILINTDEIIVNPDLETIFLPQAAAAYQDTICNFIQAIS